MKSRIFVIVTLVGVSLALVLGFGGFNAAKAGPSYIGGESPNPPAESANLIGDDEATNTTVVITKDSDFRAGKLTSDAYGLNTTLRP